MIFLRWVAIVGQLTAILVGQYVYGLQLELGLCYFAVGLSVIGNLVAAFVFPENKRLSERENLSMVMFDLLQLGFLLFLSGGLHNPFALLLLGPVTVSAAVLTTRSTSTGWWHCNCHGDAAVQVPSIPQNRPRVYPARARCFPVWELDRIGHCHCIYRGLFAPDYV